MSLQDRWDNIAAMVGVVREPQLRHILESVRFELQRLREDTITQFALERTRRLPRCLISRTSSQTIGTVTENVDWNNEVEDFFGMFDSSVDNERINIVEPGVYAFGVSLGWAAMNDATEVFTSINVANSSDALQRSFHDSRDVTTSVDQARVCISGVMGMLSGYRLRVQVDHNGTGNEVIDVVNATPFFYAHKVGGLVGED